MRSGTRWRELQEALDKAGLAVKIMQTYNTFTVGGALSVNAHGRYIGQGPLVRSVRDDHARAGRRQRRHRQPDARIPSCSTARSAAMARSASIAHVTLDVAENSRVRRDDEKIPVADYLAYFRKHVRDDSTVVFHNADIYPPAYENVHARLVPEDRRSR